MNKIDFIKKNWIGLSKEKITNEYRKAILKDYKVKFIKEKSFKSKKKLPVYIGLSEIYDYKKFWDFADIKNKEFIKKGRSFIFDKFLQKILVLVINFLIGLILEI